MAEYNTKASRGDRPPSLQELAEALKTFFRQKLVQRDVILDFEAGEALKALSHLTTAQESMPNGDPLVPYLVLKEGLDAIGVRAIEKPTDSHRNLTRALLREMRKACDGALSNNQTHNGVRALCRVGLPLEARAILLEFREAQNDRPVFVAESKPWQLVAKSLGKLNDEEELLRTMDMFEKYSIPFRRIAHQTMVEFYAARGDFVKTKFWYEREIQPASPDTPDLEVTPSPACYTVLLRFCIKNNQLEWGQEIFREAVKLGNPSKETWDVVFQWAAVMGKGVDEIDRMMNVMVSRNTGEGRGAERRPDVQTINGLVELAILRNDPYLAERYVNLGQKWGIEPDAKTLALQMDYRINVGDLDGALAAYNKLQSVETDKADEADEEKDLHAINRLIQALAKSKRYKFEDVMRVVEDLNERKARFEPETVSTLALLHIQRDEIHDAVDLLQTHAFKFSIDQRASIRDKLVEFCLDRKNSLAKAWDTYMILQHIFIETKRETRTKLMMAFFGRNRPDMACYVFNHMKEHQNPDIRPTVDTYVACLEGIAQLADEESLEVIHNSLRINMDVEPTTRLRNALMLAYIAVENPNRALEFWDDITSSREGPTYNSIHIAFRACEVPPIRGDIKARQIWSRLKKMDIEISPDMYASYVSAIAGNHLFDEAKELIERMELETGHPPDAFM